MANPPLVIKVRALPGATSGWLSVGDQAFPCAIGWGGVVTDKREGDGGTPAGAFALREAFYRPDREGVPATGLRVSPIRPDDGWCDDAADPQYNRPVRMPHAGRCETLWRDDGLYDLLAVIGWNDDPPAAGLGSAIFLHVAHEGGAGLEPTEGCVALRKDDLKTVFARIGEAATIEIGFDVPTSKGA
ncbi:MAG TPA: L,D-transpeptidase family protein [Caulobacteraceae bacterium]|jgi:L,D-peptidoglycan transpeptidase YkuD (ErfK/YbiS/YcfS/YnhG family)|nr:L,D-transpeptidase family protein [Caulobacteraceae bacterium]